MFITTAVARLLGVAFLLLATISVTAAHASYVSSVPAADATLAAAPERVSITFSQLLDAAQSSITVVDATGATVSQGTAAVLASDGHVLEIALQPNLPPGRYTVQWKNLSAEDGETEEGEFSFTVAERGTAPATGDAGTGTGTSTQTTGGTGGALPQLPNTGLATPAPTPALLALALVALVSGLALRRRMGYAPAQSVRSDHRR